MFTASALNVVFAASALTWLTSFNGQSWVHGKYKQDGQCMCNNVVVCLHMHCCHGNKIMSFLLLLWYYVTVSNTNVESINTEIYCLARKYCILLVPPRLSYQPNSFWFNEINYMMILFHCQQYKPT